MFNFTTPLGEVFATIPECVYSPGWGYAGDGHLDDGQGSSYLLPVLRLLSAMAGAKLEDVKTWDYKRIDKFLTEKKIDTSKLFPIKADDRGTFITGYTPKVWLSPEGKPVVLFGPAEIDPETGLGPNCFEVTYLGKKDWKVGSLEGSVSSYEKGKEKIPTPKLDLTGFDGVTTLVSIPIMVKDMSEAAFKIEAVSVLSGSKSWSDLLKAAPELGSGGEYSNSPILRDWQVCNGDYEVLDLYGPYGKSEAEWLNFMVRLRQGTEEITVSVPFSECNSAQCLRGKRPLDSASPLAEECRKQLAKLNEQLEKGKRLHAKTLKTAAERVEKGEDVPTWLLIKAKVAMGVTYTYQVKNDIFTTVKKGIKPINEKGYAISPKVAFLASAPNPQFLGGVLDIPSLGDGIGPQLMALLPSSNDSDSSEPEAMPF